MKTSFPILGPSAGSSVRVNPQKTINMYARLEGSGAKSPITLKSTEGFTKAASSGTGGAGRSNGIQWKGRHYFVIGSSLIAIDSVNIIYNLGTLTTNSGRVEFAAGRNYLLIVDGSAGNTYDGTTFAAITDPDFPVGPTHAVYIDGYFLVNYAGTDSFFRSKFEDPTDWDSLLFEVASASPDDITALAAYDRNILAFGSKTIQLYFNTGGSGFNFAPYPNTVQMGLAAPYSVVKTPYGVCFLSVSESGGYGVINLSGGAKPVSNADDHEEISELTDISNAVGMTYTMKGHTFYVLTFPGDGVTKSFDLSQGMSHHRQSYGVGRWRVNGLGFAGDRVLAVDYAADSIYALSSKTYTENGEIIERIRDTQITAIQRNEFSVPLFEVEASAGVGLPNGQGSNPMLGLAISRNGGIRYSGFRYKPLGRTGEDEKQTVWHELGGDLRQLNARIKYTEPTDFEIIGGYVEVLP